MWPPRRAARRPHHLGDLKGATTLVFHDFTLKTCSKTIKKPSKTIQNLHPTPQNHRSKEVSLDSWALQTNRRHLFRHDILVRELGIIFASLLLLLKTYCTSVFEGKYMEIP